MLFGNPLLNHLEAILPGLLRGRGHTKVDYLVKRGCKIGVFFWIGKGSLPF
ncbi:hypothetical protein EVA_01406 [gut metagenome]|uniref:Uncharacterized protein n=1 Tax=gut metagenome TaxID=749906 RepID=J9H348_9ZZZZ